MYYLTIFETRVDAELQGLEIHTLKTSQCETSKTRNPYAKNISR